VFGPPLHRTIVVVDIAGFTNPMRTEMHQNEMHASLYRVLSRAFGEAGMDLEADGCVVADRGDGALIVMPSAIPKGYLVDRLPDRLVSGVARHNATYAREASVQLRMGLHFGEVRFNERGVVSPAVNHTFRIVEAEGAKHALRTSGAALAIVASDPFYREVIAQDPAAAPGEYTQIPVEVKETSTSAWLLLCGRHHGGSLNSSENVDGIAQTYVRPVVLGGRSHTAIGDSAHRAIPAAGTSAPHGEAEPVRLQRPYSDTPPARDEPVPLIWGEVPPKNSMFTGRKELLNRLAERLSTGRATAVVPAALQGMGGIGKTQVAVEYIYRHLEDYDIVWWIQAAQTSQVRKALAELAAALELPGSSEVHTAVPAVREALRLGSPYSRWLLVFDAAEDVEGIRTYFPENGPGHILVTTRNTRWTRFADPLEVAVFRREESVALLLKGAPDISERNADLIAEKLADVPLAVEPAAALLRAETGMLAEDYLSLFDAKVAEISVATARGPYEIPVDAAWKVSIDVLEEKNPAAHQLLQVCSFFAPEPISRSLFIRVRGIPMPPELAAALRDPVLLGRAIRDINRYSLAKVDYRTDTLQLHRLVHLVFRNQMSDELRQGRRHVAHALLANLDPNEPKSSKSWPRYQDIWPHVYSADVVNCDDAWVRQLVINLMQFLYFWGDHSEAAELAAHALEQWRPALGDLDPQVLEAGSYLGLYRWALGRYDEAAELNSDMLSARMTASGEDSEETIVAELRVAVDVRTAGDFTRARKLNERIHEKARTLYGDDDPVTLQTAHDLAVSIRLCGDYRRAYELDSTTSKRRAEVLGRDSVDTLNTQSGMYIDRRELGDYLRALDEHEKFTRRVREILGEDKADTLRRLVYLAVARRKAGDHNGAIELSRSVLDVLRQRYGDDHPNTMACALAYSIDLRHTEDLEEAYSFGEHTYFRYRDNLGERHPHTIAAAVDLAVTIRLRDDPLEAQQRDERSLDGLRTALGPDHPYAIACAINLASDLAARNECREAHLLGLDALERACRVLGSKHPTALAARLNVAFDLKVMGEHEEAEQQHAALVEHYRETLGDDHPATKDAIQRTRANCEIDPLPS
jgi:tetratricopeptide (TPR) repeat protein